MNAKEDKRDTEDFNEANPRRTSSTGRAVARNLFGKAFAFASAVSLAFSLAIVVLWARGEWVGDVWSLQQARFTPHIDAWVLESGHGSLLLTRRWTPMGNHSPPPMASRWRTTPPMDPASAAGYRTALGRLGIYHGKMVKKVAGGEIHLMQVGLPCWMVLLPTLPLSWSFARRARRRWNFAYRTRHGLCVACGYDLRGSCAGGRCPECGMARDAASTTDPAMNPAMDPASGLRSTVL